MQTRACRSEVGERYGEMLSRYLGSAVLRAFADDDVTEIYLNPKDGLVRLDTRSRGKVESETRLDASKVEMFLNCVASSLGLTLGPESPRLEAELPIDVFRGSRLQGFVPPVTTAPAFNIRKPPSVIYSLDDYVTAGVITPEQRRELQHAVFAHRNILIAGGTNSGKTTFANAILREITDVFPRERIVVLEDTAELQCSAADYVALRTSAGVTLADLVRSTMRVSPNRIVVGEVRGTEALELLDVWATGHPGGVATVHASSTEGALHRLERLARRANVPSQRELVAETIHVVAVIEATGGHRRVSELARVDGLDSENRFKFSYLTTEGDCT